MGADRYLKVILTIIAIELGWIALTHTGSPVSAQQQAAAPTPVVIAGIDLRESDDFMPVGVLGQVRNRSAVFQPVDMMVRNERERAIPVSLPSPLEVRTINAIRIDSDRPIKVENVGYTPAQRPGE
jgi:hypothetical protein